MAGLRPRAGQPAAALTGLALLGVVAADFSESVAHAGFVKNGLRPGQRGRVELLRPPPAGTKVRIRAPSAADRPAAEAVAPRAQQRHAWFWEAHAPGAAKASSRRWGATLTHIKHRQVRGLGVVEAGQLARIRATYGEQIVEAARRHDVSEALLLAMIAVESGGRPDAVSPKGAQGLMQLIPATAQRFGVGDAFEASANIVGGAAYLDWLLREFNGDVLLALAGYNAGEGAVRRHGGVPPYAETRDYIALVMEAVAAASALCEAPLDGPRTSCRWKPRSG